MKQKKNTDGISSDFYRFSESDANRILKKFCEFSDEMRFMSTGRLKVAVKLCTRDCKISHLVRWYVRYETILSEIQDYKKQNQLTDASAQKQINEMFDLRLNDKSLKKIFKTSPTSFQDMVYDWLENTSVPNNPHERTVTQRLAKRLRPFFPVMDAAPKNRFMQNKGR